MRGNRGAGDRAVGGEQGSAELDQRPLQRRVDLRQPLPHLPSGVCERRLTGTASRQPVRKTAVLTALGPERRELRAQPHGQQLEEPFRRRQPGQRVAAEILHLEPAGDQLTRGLREQDLAAVSGRTDPGRPVDVDTEIAAAFYARLTRVQPHPDAQRDPLRPAMLSQQLLCRNRRRHSILRPLKDREELISAALDLVATRLRHRLAQQTPVLFPNSTEVFSEPMHKRR